MANEQQNQLEEKLNELKERISEEINENLEGSYGGPALKILQGYKRTFDACKKRTPNFEKYNAIIVMDREGRIPYYGMLSYCKEKDLPLPNPDNVFFIKTSNRFLMDEFMQDSVKYKKVMKKSLKGSFFNTQMKKMTSQFNPDILLLDASCGDWAKQVNATKSFLSKLYGNKLNISSYIVSRELDSNWSFPLVSFRKGEFFEMFPSNILNLNGFEIIYEENDLEVKQKGFMQGDLIGVESQDNLVNNLKKSSDLLAKIFLSDRNKEELIPILTESSYEMVKLHYRYKEHKD